jgi:hypothetical protein
VPAQSLYEKSGQQYRLQYAVTDIIHKNFLRCIKTSKSTVYLYVYLSLISSDLIIMFINFKQISFSMIYYEEMFLAYMFKNLFFITTVEDYHI